jgi:hypothetical protein
VAKNKKAILPNFRCFTVHTDSIMPSSLKPDVMLPTAQIAVETV